MPAYRKLGRRPPGVIGPRTITPSLYRGPSRSARPVSKSGYGRPSMVSGPRTSPRPMFRPRTGPRPAIAVAPPPKAPSRFARYGSQVAGMVKRHKGISLGVGAAVATAGAVVNSTGRSVDRTMGRPTGIYGY